MHSKPKTVPTINPRWRMITPVLIGCLAGSLWFANQWLTQQDREHDLFAPQACDLTQGPCRAERGQQRITFSVDNPPPDSHTPMPLRVELSGFNATQVEVDLQGVEMFMGLNRYTLIRHLDGSYQATGQLPACTTGEMQWRARVLITTPAGITGSWFDFTAR